MTRLSSADGKITGNVDPEIAAAIEHEAARQEEGLELIASENFVSPAVSSAAWDTQISSGTISIAPHGHSAAQIPHPLQ